MGAFGRYRRKILKASGRYREIRKTSKRQLGPKTRGARGAFGRQPDREAARKDLILY